MLATFKGENGDHETNADDFFLCVGYIGLQVVQLVTHTSPLVSSQKTGKAIRKGYAHEAVFKLFDGMS